MIGPDRARLLGTVGFLAAAADLWIIEGRLGWAAVFALPALVLTVWQWWTDRHR